MTVGSSRISSEFDVGQFLSSYDTLKEHLNAMNSVLEASKILKRWDVPSVSFIFCVFVMTLCIYFPEFLFAFGLFPIPLVLLGTYMKSLGEQKQIRHIIVMAVENEEQHLKRKQELIERSRKDLKRFIKVLCEIQYYMDIAHRKMSVIRSVFLWKDPKLTTRFLGYIFVLMLLTSVVPLSLIFLVSFLYFVLYNDDFRKVVTDNLYIDLPQLESLQESKAMEKGSEENGVDNPTISCDANSSIDSDTSSYEDDSQSGEDTEDEDNINPGKQSKSFVSHISEYRKRRQELKKGNCVACDIAFSSILTRRKYCRRCGDKFCSKCCRHRVKKAALGVTAPGSRDQRVLVCNGCYGKLRLKNAPGD
ncbi:protrudin-like [Xenia sp. Carnegie-2017]|uniref:protrudin-like n=1 Tax=Xenia sp. Carnegie-2017 TaxID=2897299 RepID=UPI001F0332CC|nr:protrudin-like [Xenia sp. Carnegie-2017]